MLHRGAHVVAPTSQLYLEVNSESQQTIQMGLMAGNHDVFPRKKLLSHGCEKHITCACFTLCLDKEQSLPMPFVLKLEKSKSSVNMSDQNEVSCGMFIFTEFRAHQRSERSLLPRHYMPLPYIIGSALQTTRHIGRARKEARLRRTRETCPSPP